MSSNSTDDSDDEAFAMRQAVAAALFPEAEDESLKKKNELEGAATCGDSPQQESTTTSSAGPQSQEEHLTVNAGGKHEPSKPLTCGTKQSIAPMNAGPSETRQCEGTQGSSKHGEVAGSDKDVETMDQENDEGHLRLAIGLVPGAYHVSHPDATGQDDWWQDAEDAESNNETQEVQDPASSGGQIVLTGTLVREMSNQNLAAQDEELGGLHASEEPIDGVKEQTPTQERRRFIVAMTCILILMLVILIMILTLAGVFQSGSPFDQEASPIASSVASGNATTSPIQGSVPGHINATEDNGKMTTIEQIQKQGYLPCAYQEFMGIMYKDKSGKVVGFAAAYYYAVAAALGVEVKFFPKDEPNGMSELFWTRSHTMELQVKESLSFTTPISYAGLQMAGDPTMIEHCVDKGLRHTGNCSTLRVCVDSVDSESSHLDTLSKLLPQRLIIGINLINGSSAFTGLVEGVCNVVARDSFFVAPMFAQISGYDGHYAISDTFFSRQPVAFVTSSKDPEFSSLVNGVVEALYVAEQLTYQRNSRQVPFDNGIWP
ncbi:extracellular solute-binding protein [Seminavis robusta]|uniref:Extracellular solute-binding protein n=1 Tax=Seminavis robusta TaxID=568900 RepID=A0A9N8EJ89_9STRA|nr:extracellular solute-binding protein [Seminavis robusta]|eukprot:Sro1292_g259960.1 extracellular solute-binding protein (545) ;mRNA; f:2365-4161